MEMAEALKLRGLNVTVVEIFDQIMPQFLDLEMALLAAKHLRQKGVDLALGEKCSRWKEMRRLPPLEQRNEIFPQTLWSLGSGCFPMTNWLRRPG